MDSKPKDYRQIQAEGRIAARTVTIVENTAFGGVKQPRVEERRKLRDEIMAEQGLTSARQFRNYRKTQIRAFRAKAGEALK